jgi:hypothetical protein
MKDAIEAKNFYQDNGDKIRINWFCYEYANNLYNEIKADKKLSQYRKDHTPTQMAEMCIYLAKRMKKSINDKQTGKSENVAIHAQYIYEYNRKYTQKQAKALIEVALTAWEATLLGCTVCPSQCLIEAYELTPMFDNLVQTGWPTTNAIKKK